MKVNVYGLESKVVKFVETGQWTNDLNILGLDKKKGLVFIMSLFASMAVRRSFTEDSNGIQHDSWERQRRKNFCGAAHRFFFFS